MLGMRLCDRMGLRYWENRMGGRGSYLISFATVEEVVMGLSGGLTSGYLFLVLQGYYSVGLGPGFEMKIL